MVKSDLSLAGTRHELLRLNENIRNMCGSSYELHLDQYRFRTAGSALYDNGEYDILLCLFHRGRCISSISGKFGAERSVEILSKTAPEYEGLKINLFLRTAFIYLMYFVRPAVQKVVSQSVNPISTYVMYKHYGAANPDLQEYVRGRGLDPATFALADAVAFHKSFRQTRESAEEELQGMLEYGTLEEFGWETEEQAIEFIMETMNAKAVMVELNLTAELQGLLLNKLATTQIRCEDANKMQIGGKSRRRGRRRGRGRRQSRKAAAI